MKIWIDIGHTPQNNFYRNLILRLVSEGHEVFITVLRRGKTPVIVRRELASELGKSEEIRGKIEEVRAKSEKVRGKNEEGRMQVLFSLEEKHRRGEYPEDWILLQEPIEDIHSLMYYSAGLVSSGDSMAREAALLGIPAYYLGKRHSMPANLAAAKVAGLQNERTQPFAEWLSELRGKSEEVRTQEQEELRKKIDAEFIDINQYMLALVENS